MGLILSIILVLVVVLILYSHIVHQIPKRWRVLGSGSLSGAKENREQEQETPVYGPELPPASANYWLVSQDNGNSRVVRAFSTPIRAPGQVYDPPLLYFSCYAGQLYSWLDTRLRAASASGNDGVVRISMDGAPAMLWPRERGTIVAAPVPRVVLKKAEQDKTLSIRLSFDEAPLQTLTLTLNGRAALKSAIRCGG